MDRIFAVFSNMKTLSSSLSSPTSAADEITPPRYSHSDVAVGPEWSNDTESYAGGSTVTGRVSNAGQVEGDDPH